MILLQKKSTLSLAAMNYYSAWAVSCSLWADLLIGIGSTRSISLLENDMAAIRAEHETQERIIRGQKFALDSIVIDLGSLRLLGKDRDASRLATPVATPAPDLPDSDESGQSSLPRDEEKQDGIEYGELPEGMEDGGVDGPADLLSSSKFGLSAQGLVSRQSGTPLSSQRGPQSQGAVPADGDDDDIEMGEVAEDPKQPKAKRKLREELEEGEASDSSSALSDPPDD